ncbi:OB-fold nucleic acid binding domain-containing protein [Actinomadura macra]|uniref:OB-fold nucleic acid binding domain-containing protein n=1 Tax=Actinomadura macra TaxID=46164 RepID=UPI000A05ACD2|nr:OB-fold nucleic acid binding domain-containing protein [Actinomadura macra]
MDELPAGAPRETDPAVPDRGKGGLRRFLRRMASTKAELEAEELQKTTDDEGATPITDCAARKRHCVAGTLRTVTLRPRGGAPALEAELYDGTDVINLVWLGRRKIAGIDPGRRLRAEGLVSLQDGRKVMFNPRYELRGGS